MKTLAIAALTAIALSACGYHHDHGRYDRDAYFNGMRGAKVYPGDLLSDSSREDYKGGKQ